MYGNTPFGADVEEVTLTPEERRSLRRDLASVAARTRELLPREFVVGSEITDGAAGPSATVAVQPPLGSVVSAKYDLDGDGVDIDDEELEELVHGLAASAALQVKQAVSDEEAAVAK